MNTDILKGNWKQLRGKIKERWGRLTDDEIERAEGKIDQLAGSLQKAYGKTREDVHREIDEFLRDHRENEHGEYERELGSA